MQLIISSFLVSFLTLSFKSFGVELENLMSLLLKELSSVSVRLFTLVSVLFLNSSISFSKLRTFTNYLAFCKKGSRHMRFVVCIKSSKILIIFLKFPIWETLNLSTCAHSSTNTKKEVRSLKI